MAEYIMAQANGRKIPKEDKIFGISTRAKAMIAEKGKENVVNATIGALLDDRGDLIVMSSVVEELKKLNPTDRRQRQMCIRDSFRFCLGCFLNAL